MIFQYCKTNIFDLYPQAIVHPVNCQGLCHDPLSKQIKRIWPHYFAEYTRNCLRKRLSPGQATFFPLDALFGTKYIVTLTVKDNWQEKISKQFIYDGLQSLLEQSQKLELTSIAIPRMDGVLFSWMEDLLKKSCARNESNKPEICYFFS